MVHGLFKRLVQPIRHVQWSHEHYAFISRRKQQIHSDLANQQRHLEIPPKLHLFLSNLFLFLLRDRVLALEYHRNRRSHKDLQRQTEARIGSSRSPDRRGRVVWLSRPERCRKKHYDKDVDDTLEAVNWSGHRERLRCANQTLGSYAASRVCAREPWVLPQPDRASTFELLGRTLRPGPIGAEYPD